MKLKTPSILLLCTLMSASANPPSDLQKQLDSFAKGNPGGVAVVWVDADGTEFYQTGTFSANDPRPITPDTQFELGSVSKIFTSLLLAESERLGQVNRKDAAAKYLLPANDPAQAALSKITLLSLSTHTAGLPRLPSNIGAQPDANPDPYARYDRAMLIEAFRQDGQRATPNGSVNYSNFGAAILGEALAAAWGTSYDDALRAHVLTPLGMMSTSLGLAGSAPAANLAPGHANGVTVPNWTFQAVAPAGAVRSSAREMAIFLSACLSKTKAPMRSAIDATMQPQYPADDVGGQIGLGWFMTGDAAHPLFWHNGATAGSHTFLAFSPTTGSGVVILSNNQKASEAFGFGLLGATPPRPKANKLKDALSYVGHYPLSPAFAIDVTEADGALRGQATGQPPFGMRGAAPDRFTIVGIPAEISFERDATGKITALVLHQNGQNQRAPRENLPPPRTTVVLPIETLHEYIGTYPLSAAFVITITEENGTMMAQATAQPKLPLFASAKDEFFYKVVDAQISFQRDAAGKVVGLVLHQGGQNVPAKKVPN